MSAISRLPFETLLQITQQVSIADLHQSSTKKKDYPSGFHVANLSRPTLHALLLVKPFCVPAQCVLNASIILKGPSMSYPEKMIATQHLIDRILDPENGLRSQIREIVVADWWDTEYNETTKGVVNSKWLENIVFAVEDLRVLKTPKLWGMGIKWEENNLEKLNLRFPRLRGLFIDFPLEEESWPTDCFNALAKFSNMEELTIRVLLPTPFNTQGPPQVSMCQKKATDLFKYFFAHNPDAKLRALQFTVMRSVPVPIQDMITYTVVVGVKRLEGDDKMSPLDGGFDVQISNGNGGNVGDENESISEFLGLNRRWNSAFL